MQESSIMTEYEMIGDPVDRCHRLPGECQGDVPEGHSHVVYGQSGEYRVVSDDHDEITRDDRPWQMTH
jgi:hypothetical protein